MYRQPHDSSTSQPVEPNSEPAQSTQPALQRVRFEPGDHGNTGSSKHRKEVRAAAAAAAAARASHAVRRAQPEAEREARIEAMKKRADGRPS